MSEVANLSVKVSADVQSAMSNLDSVSQKMESVGKKISDIGGKMTTFITLPILGAGGASFKMASDFDESMNKVSVAFKDNAKDVVDWSKSTLGSIGIAQQTALDMSSLFGDMGTSMGLPTDKASEMSMSLVGLAGDLASFKNVSTDIAQSALKGIFTGETESLKGLGIVMNDTMLTQYALSQGYKTSYKDMSQAEKVQLRYAYVMDATKNAQGDFARTSDGAANQMRIFTESIKQVGVAFGQVLLPIITPIIQSVNNFMAKLQGLDTAQRQMIVTVLAVVASIGPLLLIIGNGIMWFAKLQQAISIVSTVIANAGGSMALLTTSILPVIAVIAGLIAVGYLLYKNWETIVEYAQIVSTWVVENFQWLFDGVTEIFNNLVASALFIWNELYKTISVYIDLIKSWISIALTWIQQFWDKWGADIMSLVMLYFNIIKDTITTYINIVKNIISAVLAFIRGDWDKAWEYLWNAVELAFTWIKDTVITGLNGIKDKFFEILKKIDLFQIGKNIIDGLWNGISNAASALWNKLTDLANKIADKFASILKIHSPSKVFFGFGENIVEGLANGINNANKLIDNAVIGMGEVTVNGYMNNETQNSGYSSGTINQNITINAPTELSPQEVAKQTSKLARQLVVGLY